MEDLTGRWAHQMGIKVHKDISLIVPGEYGTQGLTTSHIAKGSTLCVIPFSSCITPRLACESFSVSFKVIADENLEAIILAAYLLQERDLPDSQWRPYIVTLPTTFSSPQWWSKNDLAWLNGTNLEGETARRFANMQTQIDKLYNALPYAIDMYGLKDWTWATEIIRSRSFPSSLIDTLIPESHPILLPVLDTFNHKSPHPITWQSDYDAQTLSFVSGTDYEAADQIFNNYGGKSNEELLMSYGFCIPDLECDHVTLKLSNSTGKVYYLTRQDPLPADIFAEIRDTFMRHSTLKLTMKGPLAELRVLETFKDALLPKYEKLMETANRAQPTNRAQRDAFIYRIGQIEMCRNSIDICLARMRELLNDDSVVPFAAMFEDTEFCEALETLYGLPVRSAEDAMDKVDQVAALFFWQSQKSIRKLNERHDEGELREDINDTWEEIESLRVDAPKIFGKLTRADFGAAFMVQDATLFVTRDAPKIFGSSTRSEFGAASMVQDATLFENFETVYFINPLH